MSAERRIAKSDPGRGIVEIGPACVPGKWTYRYVLVLLESRGEWIEGSKEDSSWMVTVPAAYMPRLPCLSPRSPITLKIGNWPVGNVHFHRSLDHGNEVDLLFGSDPATV
jgi:hypothetical protein